MERDRSLLFKFSTAFALYCHDIFYNIRRSDKEEESSQLANERMQQLQVLELTIKNCKIHILVTKLHMQTVNSDTNYFIDSDLCILGGPPDQYEQYAMLFEKSTLYTLILFIKRV